MAFWLGKLGVELCGSWFAPMGDQWRSVVRDDHLGCDGAALRSGPGRHLKWLLGTSNPPANSKIAFISLLEAVQVQLINKAEPAAKSWTFTLYRPSHRLSQSTAGLLCPLWSTDTQLNSHNHQCCINTALSNFPHSMQANFKSTLNKWIKKT